MLRMSIRKFRYRLKRGGTVRTAILLLCVAPLIRAQAAGVIEGTVTARTTHDAIAGVRVTWMRVGSAPFAKPDDAPHTVTDASGAFRTTELAPGDYSVMFEAADHVPVNS